ncbi:N-acetylglucosamine-6-phosphate deacetylase [Microbacterium sp. ZW T5_56]|uniref:N-acetylglucosamine-6-phosphate deacetylase n=1 Tax=Microbacterium sp. ZW T5_56 TaxID=3378081 RepID=UPI0038528ACD
MSSLILHGRDPRDGAGVEVVLSDDRIASFAAWDAAPDAPWISPGLVDLQVNGHGEGDVNASDPDPAHIIAMARSLAAVGVTRFLPTIITASPADMLARIRAVVEACADPLAAAMVAGIHLEGPSLSPEDGPRGVHPMEHIRPPAIDELQEWLEAGAGLIRIVTLSPHHEGAEAATRFLVSRDVRVAIGHTHADDDQIRAVVDAGASLSTHLGNGAHAVLPRHPNYLWSQLAEPRLAAGLIADGHHLPDATLRTMIAAKRPGPNGDHGAFLVSDAVATPAALREGGVSTVGGGVEIAADGALRHRATGFLAGSIQTLDVGVATIARLTGSLATGMELGAIAPARVLDGETPWRVGARADILRFAWAPGDARIRPVSVHVAGHEI